MVVREAGAAETALRLEIVPGSRQAVLRVEACGVCFHDVVTRNGTLKAGIRTPFIPGHEICPVSPGSRRTACRTTATG